MHDGLEVGRLHLAEIVRSSSKTRAEVLGQRGIASKLRGTNTGKKKIKNVFILSS